MATRVSETEAKNIRELLASGRSIREVAKMVGRSPRTIQRISKKAEPTQPDLIPPGAEDPDVPPLQLPEGAGYDDAIFDRIRVLVPPPDLTEDRIKRARSVADVLESEARSSSGLLLRLVKEGRYADTAAAAELCRQLLALAAAELRRITEDPDWIAELCGLKSAEAKKVAGKLLPYLRDFIAGELQLLPGRRDEFMAALKAAEDAKGRGGATVRGAKTG